MKPQKMLHEDLQVERLVSLIRISNSLGNLNKIPKKLLEYIGFYTDEHQKGFISQNDGELSKFNDEYVNVLHVLLEEIAKNFNKSSGIIKGFQEIYIPYKGNNHYLDFLLNIFKTKGRFPYKKTIFLPNIKPNGKNQNEDMQGSPYDLTIEGHITNTIDYHINHDFSKYIDSIEIIFSQNILHENEYLSLFKLIIRNLGKPQSTNNNIDFLEQALNLLNILFKKYKNNPDFSNPKQPGLFSSNTSFISSCRDIVSEIFKNDYSSKYGYWLYIYFANITTLNQLENFQNSSNNFLEIDNPKKQSIVVKLSNNIPYQLFYVFLQGLLTENKNQLSLELVLNLLLLSKHDHSKFLIQYWELLDITNENRNEEIFLSKIKIFKKDAVCRNIFKNIKNDGFLLKRCNLYLFIILNPVITKELTSWLYANFNQLDSSVWDQSIRNHKFIELLATMGSQKNNQKLPEGYSNFIINIGNILIKESWEIKKSKSDTNLSSLVKLLNNKDDVIESLFNNACQNKSIISDQFFQIFGNDIFKFKLLKTNPNVLEDFIMPIIIKKTSLGLEELIKYFKKRSIKSLGDTKQVEIFMNLLNTTITESNNSDSTSPKLLTLRKIIENKL